MTDSEGKGSLLGGSICFSARGNRDTSLGQCQYMLVATESQYRHHSSSEHRTGDEGCVIAHI